MDKEGCSNAQNIFVLGFRRIMSAMGDNIFTVQHQIMGDCRRAAFSPDSCLSAFGNVVPIATTGTAIGVERGMAAITRKNAIAGGVT